MNLPSANPAAELTQTMVDDEHPWPGLASFREQDAHFFKGRESDIETLHGLVNRERLSILFGISGLGKSSLLQAGLFPQLRQDSIFPMTIRLDFGVLATSLREQVFTAIAQQIKAENIEAPQHREDETLWEYFQIIFCIETKWDFLSLWRTGLEGLCAKGCAKQYWVRY